jgi:hypothetical protein
MTREFWLGFIDGILFWPALFGVLLLVVRSVDAFDRRVLTPRKISIQFRKKRSIQGIFSRDLEEVIWWEKQRGPVFTGHWYYEHYDGSPAATRWFGIGKAEGMCLMFFKVYDL